MNVPIEIIQKKAMLMGLNFNIFDECPVLMVLSEKRHGGLGLRGENDEELRMNQERRIIFLNEVNVSEVEICHAGLAHKGEVQVVGERDRGRIIDGVDGLVTKDKNVFLSVRAADCPTIFVFDPVKKVAGIAHAGWRGLAHNILANLICEMGCLGSEPSDVKVGVGPGICAQCYEFDYELARMNNLERFWENENKEGKGCLNLKEAVKEQMVKIGILFKNMEIDYRCTKEDSNLMSRRRDGQCGMMLAVIGCI